MKRICAEDFWTTFFKILIVVFCLAESIYIPTVIIMKLCGFIDWPWYIVLIPFEADGVLGAIGILVCGVTWIIETLHK